MKECFLFTFILFISSVSHAYRIGESPKEYLTCNQDSDCIWVPGDCCGFKTVIAQPFAQKWVDQMKIKCPSPGKILCPAVIDEAPIRNLPGCVNNLCKQNVIENYSAQEANFCQNLPRPEQRSYCLWDVAMTKFLPELCAQIDDTLPFVAQNKRTSRECRVGVQRQRIEKGPLDLAFCNSVSEPSWQSSCMTKLAETTKDANLCLKMINPNARMACAGLIIKPNLGAEQCNPFVRKQDSEADQLLAICVARTAAARNDPSICEKLYETNESSANNSSMTYTRWYGCIAGMAQQLKNPEICNALLKHKVPISLSHVSGYNDANLIPHCKAGIPRR